ncbi:hypothetical protein I302_100334 [Kwoniella bestiolae CBS 10118]|uniref:Uncharacterized protein n=1 Tax=Kwoniella bestiolae CBS 10118 TaxID=1296100 RepID=A0A1B9G4R3_9TREE|nr:hypothetical protein I302_03706 [Kwoniella bestiolae CBS 10118]OCF26029.1 hypothetical protein I302_03706 [Kwoniella bestiolae CBS 10118]
MTSHNSAKPDIRRVSETEPQRDLKEKDKEEADTTCFLPSCEICDETFYPQDQDLTDPRLRQENSRASDQWDILKAPGATFDFSIDLQSTIKNLTLRNRLVAGSQEQELGSTIVRYNQNTQSTYQEGQAIRAERLRSLLEGTDENDQKDVDPDVAEAYGAIRAFL